MSCTRSSMPSTSMNGGTSRVILENPPIIAILPILTNWCTPAIPPMVTWPSRTVPGPRTAPSSITLKGPTMTSSASSAPGCTLASGWILGNLSAVLITEFKDHLHLGHDFFADSAHGAKFSYAPTNPQEVNRCHELISRHHRPLE